MRVKTVKSIIVLFSLMQFTFAADISGRVTDVGSGDFLPGANVIVEGTNFGASSDRSGSYKISGLVDGDYTLTVSYIGYSDYSAQVTVAGENVTNDIQLSVSYINMEAVNVSGLAQGQVKALNQQRSAGNIKNIVSSDMIEQFPDQNVADAIQRLPGVALETDHGEGRYVQIRGA